MRQRKRPPAVPAEHNVFISWSKARSHAVAEALHEWLPKVVQTIRPWMSSADIEKGEPWSPAIARRLDSIAVGIICFTRENVDAPWLNFEAGALSKAVKDVTRVCPYLFGLQHTDLTGPLSQFQTTLANRVDTEKLVGVIAHATGSSLTEPQIAEAVKLWWPMLEEKLAAVPTEPAKQTPLRSERELLEELVERTRGLERQLSTPVLAPQSGQPDHLWPYASKVVESRLLGSRFWVLRDGRLMSGSTPPSNEPEKE